MNESRLKEVLALLQERGARQMILTEMNSVFYLTGKMIYTGSRLLVLLLRADGQHCLFLNQLYAEPQGLGIEIRRFSDSDDLAAIVASATDHCAPLGVDRKMPAGFLLALQELRAGSSYLNASACVEAARSRKDAQEQQLMLAASRINDLAMEEFRKLIRPGVSELDVARQIENIYISLGADGLSFNPLVSFGANAADPHHKPSTAVLQEGDSVLFDVGCKKDYYCADMTRTFFFRSITSKQEEVYDLVRRANLAGEAAIRPGVRFCDVDQAARGLIAQAGYGPNFTHRLGHSIGLELHEPGDANPVNTDLVQEGNIFSCEPGVYIPGQFGVRIEDLCLVTENGVTLLNSYPKELQVIP
jgi:Xaa-Pro dipeptidase